MRTLALLALLAFATPALADPAATTARRSSQRVGSRWLGADFVQGVRARHDGRRAEAELFHEARLRLATSALPVFGIRERTAATDLHGRPLVTRGVRVSLLGMSSITVTQALWKKSLIIKKVTLPVATVGPFPVTLEVECGAYVQLRLRGEVAWKDGVSTAGGVEVMARIGGTARLATGVPGAKVGIKGELDILKVRTPAMVVLRVDSVTLDVRVIIESRAAIKLFAKVGIGPFSKEFTLTVPYLDWHFYRRELIVCREQVKFRR
jgi:hypothetical protein